MRIKQATQISGVCSGNSNSGIILLLFSKDCVDVWKNIKQYARVILIYNGHNDNNNDNIFISVHLSQGMIINYVHVHYANFALIIVMNLTNFNNITADALSFTYRFTADNSGRDKRTGRVPLGKFADH